MRYNFTTNLMKVKAINFSIVRALTNGLINMVQYTRKKLMRQSLSESICSNVSSIKNVKWY